MLERFHIRSEIKDQHEEMVRVRRDLHRHPELGFQEHRTSGIIAEAVRALGLDVTSGIAKTGVVALARGGKPGPTILVRADMDGLPLQEDSSRDYASQRAQAMHACGHDGHIAMALAVARVVAGRRKDMAGNVKFVFQPAEEGPGGARPMIEEGVLLNPDVDVALGLHLWNEMPVGTIGIQNGPTMAAADQFRLAIVGRGGHGALPNRAIDPIVAAAHVVTALQTIASRRVDPLKSVVVSIGSIHGGSANNIIPQRVDLEGTIRTMDPDLREALPAEVERIIRGVTEALGATYEFEYLYGYPVTSNNTVVADMVRAAAADVIGTSGSLLGARTMGGEDMSFFLNEVPGCFFFVGAANADGGLNHPHHSPRFDFDEHAMAVGAEVMLRAVEHALLKVAVTETVQA